MVVQSELEKFGIRINKIELGEVEINDSLSKQQLESINNHLLSFGFELIDNRKSQIIEKIKKIVIELVHYKNENIIVNLSRYLSDNLNYDYNYLSNLFSEVEGITIEKYYISQKIERVKELLVYDEMNLSEISYQMGYSSVAHLSNQFKKVTGLTPSHFKKIKVNKRIPLDKV